MTAVQIRLHSPRSPARPRNRNFRWPNTDLIHPNTGFTLASRCRIRRTSGPSLALVASRARQSTRCGVTSTPQPGSTSRCSSHSFQQPASAVVNSGARPATASTRSSIAGNC